MVMTQPQRRALMSSASPEWYTPQWLHVRAALLDTAGDAKDLQMLLATVRREMRGEA